MKGNSKKIITKLISIVLLVILLSFNVPINFCNIEDDNKSYAEGMENTRFIKFSEKIDKDGEEKENIYYMIEVVNQNDDWKIKSVVNNISEPNGKDANLSFGRGLFYTLHRAYLNATTASVDGTYGIVDSFQNLFKKTGADFPYLASSLIKLMEYSLYNEADDTRIINVLMKQDEGFWTKVLEGVKNYALTFPGLNIVSLIAGGDSDAIVDELAVKNKTITGAEAIILHRTKDDKGKINIIWHENEGTSYKDYMLDSDKVEASTKNPLGTSKLDNTNGFLDKIGKVLTSSNYIVISNAEWMQLERSNHDGTTKREKFIDYFDDEMLAKTLINIYENNLADEIEGFEVLKYEDIIKNSEGNAYTNDGTMSVFTNGMWSRVVEDKQDILLKIYKPDGAINKEIASFKIGTYTDADKTRYEEVYINEITSKYDLNVVDGNKKIVSNVTKGSNYFLLYKTADGKTIDDYNEIVAILNTSSKSIDIYEKQADSTLVQLGSVNREKIGKAQLVAKNVKIETEGYYLYPAAGDLKVVVKTEPGVESSTKTVKAEVIRKIHASNDMDGNNYIYFLYSPLKDNDKDSYLAYYYTDSKNESNNDKTGADYDFQESELTNIFYTDLYESDKNVLLRIGKYSSDVYKDYGKNSNQIFVDGLKDNRLSNYLDDKYTEFDHIPVTAALKLIDGVNEQISIACINSNLSLNFVYKGEEKEAYKDWIYSIMKPIIMFLVFISLLIAAIHTMWGNQIAEERAKIAQRFSHIITGIMIFVSASIILAFVVNFTENSFQEIEQISANFSGPTYDVATSNSYGGIVIWIISQVLDFFTMVSDWLIQWVQESSSGEKANLIKLIFDTYVEGTNDVSTIKPFTPSEWAIYMIGYRGLIGLAMAILSIAIIKISYGLIINSGNAQKIVEEKSTLSRILIALLGIILVPYGVRILLTLFNYIVAILPVDHNSGSFELNFDGLGIVGSIANAMFIWVKLKIYILFLVRKVMIVTMLIASPFVLSIWAISGKFRSASLWIGELVSNTATQLCYALVFFVAILITYEGQNAFVTLIIVMGIPKFAKFFRDSLQGYVQRWGGVDEESVAGEIGDRVKKYGDSAKKKITGGGRNLENVAKFIDPEGIKNSGRVLHNVGSVLQGKPFGTRTRLDQKKSIKKNAIRDNREKQMYYEATDEELNVAKQQNPELAKKIQDIENGNDSLDKYKDDKDFDVYRQYLKAKSESELAEKRKMEAIREEKDYIKYGSKKDGVKLHGGPGSSIFDAIPSPKRAVEKYEDKKVDDLVDKYFGNGDDKRTSMESQDDFSDNLEDENNPVTQADNSFEDNPDNNEEVPTDYTVGYTNNIAKGTAENFNSRGNANASSTRKEQSQNEDVNGRSGTSQQSSKPNGNNTEGTNNTSKKQSSNNVNPSTINASNVLQQLDKNVSSNNKGKDKNEIEEAVYKILSEALTSVSGKININIIDDTDDKK